MTWNAPIASAVSQTVLLGFDSMLGTVRPGTVPVVRWGAQCMLRRGA
jgi:hypothetical protein